MECVDVDKRKREKREGDNVLAAAEKRLLHSPAVDGGDR